MTNTPIKQTRNILANELGLSREVVKQIICERVDKLFRDERFDKLIEKTVIKAVNDLAATSKWDRETIRSIAANAARDHVTKHLVVSIQTPPT